MEFKVRGIDAGLAQIVERHRNAADETALRRQLATEGFVVLSVSSAESRTLRRRSSSTKLDVPAWCNELSALLNAGMTAVEATETMLLPMRGASADLQRLLIRRLHEGASLSEAMRDTKAFPKVLVAGVMASERTSRLKDALADYLAYDRQVRELRRQALSAAVYPAVVVTIGLLITLFLLIYVLPRFAKMYGTFRGDLSQGTRAMLWLSDVLVHDLPWVLCVGVIVITAFVLAFRMGWTSKVALMVADQVAPIRRARGHFVRAGLFNAMLMTLRGGYPLAESLDVCASLGLGGDVDAALGHARLRIDQGASPSVAFRATGLVDEVGQRLLAVGERGGQFPQVLETLATRHGEAFATFVQRATRVVEPLLLLAVAVIVGGIVVMMYLPVFDIANGLQ